MPSVTHSGEVDMMIASASERTLDEPIDGHLLSVEDLTVQYHEAARSTTLVDAVDFAIARGETLGIVGESGSGKTMSALAILGLVPAPMCRVTNGKVLLSGTDLLQLSRGQMNEVRGGEIGMIFQEPRRSLDPAFSVGSLIAEVARRHLHLSRRDAWIRAVETMDLVGIPDAKRRAHDFPHTFSGGMCQRVIIAMAIVGEPKLLIADEPTTALDVTVQAKVLDLIRDIQEYLGLALLFITHDLGIVSEMCDRVAVMYAGQVVETTTADDLFRAPRHPYTARLVDSLPQSADGRQLHAIPGDVPSPGNWPTGCRFHPRCEWVVERCRSGSPALEPAGEGSSRCVRASELTLVGLQ
jgi:oligopeptide/dipeptide ABC transporter ATP-binding protein